jgi:multisubunit Na+/H+ antiporter MnhB subunit
MLVGLILVFSVYLLFRGHHDPGGGFAAALVAGTGFSLFAITEGTKVVKRALRINPLTCIACGLLLAIASGLPAVVNQAFRF